MSQANSIPSSVRHRRRYFDAKRPVTGEHQYGNLNENSVLECVPNSQAGRGYRRDCPYYARCLIDVVERVLVDSNGELTLILAKALGFAWETAMSFFSSEPKTPKSTHDLEGMKEDFGHIQYRNLSECLEVLPVTQKHRGY